MNYDGSSDSSAQNISASTRRNGKRICHRHSPHQIQILEAYFNEHPHPNESQRNFLCRELNLEADQVKFWFQNKRTQSKAQDEKSTNVYLRGENKKLRSENEAMREALKNVLCPPCGGPAFGKAERERNIQTMRVENADLKVKREEIIKYREALNNRPTMLDLFAAATRISPEMDPSNVFEPPSPYGLPPSPTIELQPLTPTQIMKCSEMAANAVEELKQLIYTHETFWVRSAINGTHVINQESYVKFLNASRHVKSSSARIESSGCTATLPIDAPTLIQRLTDVDKRKELFPTIVNKAELIESFGSTIPINGNSSVVQLIYEQLHILSPLVPPREFMMVRTCQQIQTGLWLVADVSYAVINFDATPASSYKRPSGCLIQALANGYTKVMWIEHVEVDDKLSTHQMYRELLSHSTTGFGAMRWMLTLRRMCERMALCSAPTVPISDQCQVYTTWQGRKNIMKLGKRMLKEYYEELTMPKRIIFPQQSRGGVSVSMRVNARFGQPPGIVVFAASSLSLPLTPLQVFSLLLNIHTRNQWDVLTNDQVVTEVGRINTGPGGNNFVNIIKPTLIQNFERLITGQNWNRYDMMIIQDCYMDALGGMLVYAPLDLNVLQRTSSGELDPAYVPVLPSGFIISTDGSGGSPRVAADGSSSSRGGRTVLTMAFQILVTDQVRENRCPRELSERSVNTVTQLISTTTQNIMSLIPYYTHNA